MPYLIHVPFDMRAFDCWLRDRELASRASLDAGYALHILLSAAFGPAALQPFRLFAPGRRRRAGLYAYADLDAGELREMAATVATPDTLAVLVSGRMRSKAMPTGFKAGQRLGFDLRVRPVRRLARDIEDPRSGMVFSKGAELDAYRLDGLLERAGTADRGEVYADWLGARCGEAVEVETCRLAAFRRTRAVRGDGRGPEGPDATLHGELTVRDPVAFGRLVRTGIGRHKAYGYGMLLLRPPRRHSIRSENDAEGTER